MTEKRTQIAFDATEEMKYKIKEFAAKRKCTMNYWIHQVLMQAILSEEEFFKDKK